MAFLEFFMDLKLNYDVSYETDKIGPTTNPLTDIEDEMTREKLPFLYDVAMTMRDGAKPEVQLGIWRLVVDKLIDRTGMSNKEFSVWASRILAEGGRAHPLHHLRVLFGRSRPGGGDIKGYVVPRLPVSRAGRASPDGRDGRHFPSFAP